MTSKISFHKLRIEDLRHRISMILLCMFAFLTWDLMYFISIRNALAEDSKGELHTLLTDFMGPNPGVAFLLTLLAQILAIQSFRYLHSKIKGDFFHAFPVKRSRYFLMNLENDLMIFLLSYVISLLIQTAISAAHGMIDGSFALLAASGAVFCLLTFLMSYLLMTLCMILTGQTYVAIMGFLAIECYVPLLLRIAYDGLAEAFFHTYSGLTEAQEGMLHRLSPFYLSLNLGSFPEKAGSGMTAGYLLCALIWICLLLAASFILYLLRPAESAGRAMAFKKSERIIKAFLTLPLGLISGLFFYYLTNSRTLVWLYFGVIAGVIFFHGIVEIIYQTDIAGLWSHKLDTLVLLLVTVAAVLCFDMDLFGYDSYLPDHEMVESVKITRSEATGELGSGNSPEGGVIGGEKEEILDLLEKIAKESADMDNSGSYPSIQVTYFFQDGKLVKRVYYLTKAREEALYQKLYKSEEYKEKLFHLNEIEAEKITQIVATHPLGDTWWNLSTEEKQAFLDAYQKDTRKVTYDEVKAMKVAYKIQIDVETEDKDITNNYVLDIFPSYKNSIAMIEKFGGAQSSDVSELRISSLLVDYEDGGQYISEEITEKAFIDSIKDQLYYNDLKTEYYSSPQDSSLYIEAHCGDETYGVYAADEAVKEKILERIKK